MLNLYFFLKGIYMEDEIIQKAKQKDKLAFERIVDFYNDKLFFIAKTLLNNGADAQDAVQETLYDVYKDLWHLREVSKFKSWMTRILVNNCKDIISKNSTTCLCFDEDYMDRVEDSDDQMISIEENQSFFDEIDFLEQEEKNIVVMRIISGFSSHQIGDILGIKEGTVRMKILRIKEKIKIRYNKSSNSKIY